MRAAFRRWVFSWAWLIGCVLAAPAAAQWVPATAGWQVAGVVTSGGGGGTGLLTLNGLTADPQSFARVNDTNVNLGIVSSGSTHTFTITWAGTLGQSRGGFGASVAAATGYAKATAGTFSFSSTVPWADVSKSGAVPGDVGAAAATHASQHQNGGSDEIATATAAANAIPKAGSGGKLAVGWVPVATGDAGSGGTAGLVPAPATGDATKFLRGDMTYVTISGGGDALTSNPLSQFAATTSAQLAGVLSDEQGSSGGFVRGTGSTLTNTVLAGTLNVPHGNLASIPATCAQGDVYVATDQIGGYNLYACTATNTWTLMSPPGNPFTDATPILFASGDPSKLLAFSLSGISGGTTRTWTVPNSNTTIPIISQVLTFSGPTAARTYTLPDANTTVAGVATTQTLTNKRVTPRTGGTTSSATPTINSDDVDYYELTAQSGDVTSFTTNLSGTPTNAQTLWLSITAVGTVNFTWGSSFEASSIPLPTAATDTRIDCGFVWNAVSGKWRLVATA